LKRTVLALLVAIGLVIASSLAYAIMIISTDKPNRDIILESNLPTNLTSRAGPVLYVHMIPGDKAHDRPLGGRTIAVGPANSTNDIVLPETPRPVCKPRDTCPEPWPTLRQCIGVRVPSGAIVREQEKVVIAPNGSKITGYHCPMKEYKTNSSGWATIYQRANASYYLLYIDYSEARFYGTVEVCAADKTMFVTANISTRKLDVECND